MLKKLNEAMDYIEEHLEEDFSLDKIAEYVHVSDLHLRKIFFALTNMSLSDYVKKQKDVEGKSGAFARKIGNRSRISIWVSVGGWF